MVLSDTVTTRLLGAIETNSLIFLCGAGLSAAPPSNLLPATEVSKICYEKWSAIEVLDRALEERLDQLAGYFHAKGDFERVFIGLVPWNELVGPPNSGHAAIADFLISRAAHGALSTNFDTMIESWAGQQKVAMRGALTGQEAVNFLDCSNPLIKFHGCLHRGREETFWTQGQLNDAVIQARIASCTGWINLNLPDKHLVVVGFWTDWSHLNDALADALTIGNASSVTVIDPKPTAALEAAAPNLWARLNGLSRAFEHVPASGADALEELRAAYSKVWARRFYSLGRALIEGAGGAVAVAAPFDGLAAEHLYNLRRDAQAMPYTMAATLKTPADAAASRTSLSALALLTLAYLLR
jgi:hypothetical protein